MIQQAFSFQVSWYNYLFPKCIYPISGFAMTGSTYSCVLIAFERYLGICHPNTGSRFRNLKYYLIILAMACFLIDFPRFLEIEVRYPNHSFTIILIIFFYSFSLFMMIMVHSRDSSTHPYAKTEITYWLTSCGTD